MAAFISAIMQRVSMTIGSNLGFNVLSKDTLTCGHEELGIELLTL